MKRILATFAICLSTLTFAQQDTVNTSFVPSPLVDFDSYLKLANEVNEYRKDRLVSIEKFNQLAQDKNVIILDTRSDELYKAMHIKGAIHLNFSDFTQQNLDALIGSKDVKILIYCNNNIDDEPINFASKMAPVKKQFSFPTPTGQLTLALNIPTFINLYGYGFRNVYELGELVSVSDPRIQFEGTDVVNPFGFGGIIRN